jgi:hypothetical protein
MRRKLACSLMVGRSSETLPTKVEILLITFSGIFPGFIGVVC